MPKAKIEKMARARRAGNVNIQQYATIRGVRLENCHAARDEVPRPAPEDPSKAQINIEVGGRYGESSTDKLLEHFVEFGLSAFYRIVAQPLVVTAKFRVIHTLDQTAPQPSAAQIEEFGQNIVVPIVWAHWRELVQSLSQRMGYPEFLVPLFPNNTIDGSWKKPPELRKVKSREPQARQKTRKSPRAS